MTDLVGQPMQRSSQPIQSSTEGEVRVRESTAHQVTGVGTDVTSLMVTKTGTPETVGYYVIHHKIGIDSQLLLTFLQTYIQIQMYPRHNS